MHRSVCLRFVSGSISWAFSVLGLDDILQKAGPAGHHCPREFVSVSPGRMPRRCRYRRGCPCQCRSSGGTEGRIRRLWRFRYSSINQKWAASTGWHPEMNADAPASSPSAHVRYYGVDEERHDKRS